VKIHHQGTKDTKKHQEKDCAWRLAKTPSARRISFFFSVLKS
jgi:hypothetical protein